MYDKEDTKEIQSIRKIVLEKLRHGYVFECAVSREEREASDVEPPNINWSDRERCEAIVRMPAYLVVSFRLSNCRYWLGKHERDESSDKLILIVLDALAKAGRVRFLEIQHVHDERYEEVHFSCESGVGWSNFAVTDCVSKVERLYADMPLRKAERLEGKGILDVLKAVEGIREREREQLERRYGKPVDTDLERKLYHEKVMADYELGAAQIRTGKALEDKGKKQKEV